MRAVYDRQFKIAAVKTAGENGISIREVAEDLCISATSLRRWVNEYDEYGASAFPGHGNALLSSTYEIKKLEKANAALREENEILKKLQAFLKQKSV